MTRRKQTHRIVPLLCIYFLRAIFNFFSKLHSPLSGIFESWLYRTIQFWKWILVDSPDWLAWSALCRSGFDRSCKSAKIHFQNSKVDTSNEKSYAQTHSLLRTFHFLRTNEPPTTKHFYDRTIWSVDNMILYSHNIIQLFICILKGRPLTAYCVLLEMSCIINCPSIKLATLFVGLASSLLENLNSLEMSILFPISRPARSSSLDFDFLNSLKPGNISDIDEYQNQHCVWLLFYHPSKPLQAIGWKSFPFFHNLDVSNCCRNHQWNSIYKKCSLNCWNQISTFVSLTFDFSCTDHSGFYIYIHLEYFPIYYSRIHQNPPSDKCLFPIVNTDIQVNHKPLRIHLSLEWILCCLWNQTDFDMN